MYAVAKWLKEFWPWVLFVISIPFIAVPFSGMDNMSEVAPKCPVLYNGHEKHEFHEHHIEE